jgi:hypothetical protein
MKMVLFQEVFRNEKFGLASLVSAGTAAFIKSPSHSYQ